MRDTTERSESRETLAWLNRQAPGWLTPASAALALFEALAIAVQAGAIAAVAQHVFIDGLSPSTQMPLMWLLLAALLGRAALASARQYFAAGASAKVRLQLRERLLAAIERAGPAAINSTGEAIPVVDEQVEALDGYYARFRIQALTVLIVPPILAGFVFWHDWLAAALLVVTAPVIPLFMALIGIGAERLAREQHRTLARLGGWFHDQLAGAATLRLFGAEDRALARVQARTDSLRRATMRVLKLAFLSSAALEFLASVAIAAVAIYIGLGLFGAISFGPADRLTLEKGLFVLLLAPEFFAPLRMAAQSWHDRADAIAAAQGVRQLLALPPARPDADPDFRPPAPPVCGVHLRGVDYSHAGRGPLFRGLDLAIPAGQRVVLVGPSGGGKSTLISLLGGFLQPQHGEILFDGAPLARMADAARAAHVAWLGQRPALFAGSLIDNIALGWRDAGRKDIETAARLAGVQDFVSDLPEGLETPVGEGGYGLSGGQAQRVALARALLRPRPLLLLDEPTASLDPDSEAGVLAALARALEARPATVVCATHRAATMRWADRVIEVERGRLKETGW